MNTTPPTPTVNESGMLNPNADKAVDVLVVALGAYGRFYLRELNALAAEGRVRIAGVVDPRLEGCPEWPALRRAGIPGFATLRECLDAGCRAELCVISSPIAFHADHACDALSAGMNVLCEKPLTALASDACRMIEARDRSGRFLEVGYQLSFSSSIQRLKADILAGRFGAPRRMRTWIAVQRDTSYFKRNDWSGRIRDDDGHCVFDSPANNATAHYLHNMLYLLGPATDRAATPVALTGECYRGHAIENFDTACCRIETLEGVEVLFYTSHCVQGGHGPHFLFEFEKARVCSGDEGEVVVRFRDGKEERHGLPTQGVEEKLGHSLARCRIPGGGHTICGPEAALAQTLCINALQRLPVTGLAAPHVRKETIGDRGVLTYVPGLENIMRRACASGRLFSEVDLPWAGTAQRVEIESIGAARP